MNDIVLVIKSLIPVRVEAVWGTITGVMGVVAEVLFGTWSDALMALVVAMLIDYVSGVIAAYINPALSLNSQRGFRGILKNHDPAARVARARARYSDAPADHLHRGHVLFPRQ